MRLEPGRKIPCGGHQGWRAQPARHAGTVSAVGRRLPRTGCRRIARRLRNGLLPLRLPLGPQRVRATGRIEPRAGGQPSGQRAPLGRRAGDGTSRVRPLSSANRQHHAAGGTRHRGQQRLCHPAGRGERAKQGPDSAWGLTPANLLGTTLRKTRDGRLMVRSAYSSQAELPLARVRDMLQDCYRRRYPGMAAHAFEYVWGGATALTRNGALYFGEVRNGLYVSLGCNGAGVLKGTMFGKLLGEMAAGHHSPELADALGLQRPNWLPPDPIRRIAVVSALKWHKHRAGLER